MSFLSKKLLSKYAEPGAVPYPEVQDAYRNSLAYFRQIHEDGLQAKFKSLANMLCVRFQHRKPNEQQPVYAFDPGCFQYYRYGQERFLSDHLKDIVGSPEEAEVYYRKRFAEAFPDFAVQLQKRPSDINVGYSYSIRVELPDEIEDSDCGSEAYDSDSDCSINSDVTEYQLVRNGLRRRGLSAKHRDIVACFKGNNWSMYAYQ